MLKFFISEYNPRHLTGQIGGGIATELSGYLGEVFCNVQAPPVESTGTYYQYRKIFLKNEYNFTLSNVKIWLDAEQYPGQISLAGQTGTSYSISNATVEPTGISPWAHAVNYADGLEIGTFSSNYYTGIWLRQSLTNIQEPDPFVSLRLYAGGTQE